MKAKLSNYALGLSCALAGLLLAGCAWKHHEHAAYHPPTITEGYGPTYVEEDGVAYIKTGMAFPTGLQESSGLFVEKWVPVEVLVNQPFEYKYKVRNLTDHPIHTVAVTDRVAGAFTPGDAEPKPTTLEGGVATWQLGTLEPKGMQIIRVKGITQQEGAISSCGFASFNPTLCSDIRVLKPELQLSLNMPAETVLCDPIPIKVTVKNTGSCNLTKVTVEQPLPEGLTSEGKTTFTREIESLAPGETREWTISAMAAKPGSFINTASVSSKQGAKADATANTQVRQPALEVTCDAPNQQFIGRAFDVHFTVVNRGDANALEATLQAPLPAGLAFQSATAGGRLEGSRILWSLGSMAPGAQQEVACTLVSHSPSEFKFTGSAEGICAKLVSATDQIKTLGVAGLLLEKADDRDPIQIGETTTYTVKVTNQGTAEEKNIHVVVTMPSELVPVSAPGDGKIDGQMVTFPTLPTLAPKEVVTYQIVAKGVKVGDAHTRVVLNSDVLTAPLLAEESTHVY